MSKADHVIRDCEIIGETCRNIEHHHPGYAVGHPEVPWADIIGMRHKVVHDYLGVDEDIVWQVVTDDLPSLIEALAPLVPPETSENSQSRGC